MKPGRELDALIAEKVLGWRVSSGTLDGVEFEYVCAEKNRANFFDTVPLPHFSTDIAAAWEVVEKLPKETEKYGFGYDFDLRAENGEWICGWYMDDMGWSICASAPTAAHAICLAALKAVEDDGHRA